MHRRIIIYNTRTGLEPDHFLKKVRKGLKKAVKKIGNVGSDVLKLGAQPFAKSLSSITGKEYKQFNTFNTKLGKVAGKVQGTGLNTLHTTLKGFADTVTGGYATKGANLLRKEGRKEKPYAYNEQKQVGQDTGVKFLDKAAVILPTTGAVIGGTIGGAMAGNKALSLGEKQESSNMPDTGVVIGSNVLTGEPSPMSTNEIKTASGLFANPIAIGAAVLALLVLAMLVNNNK